MNLLGDSSETCFLLFIPPFSAETIEQRRENNGRSGWTSERRGGTEGVREGEESVWDTHTRMHACTCTRSVTDSQKEARWREVKGQIGQ